MSGYWCDDCKIEQTIEDGKKNMSEQTQAKKAPPSWKTFGEQAARKYRQKLEEIEARLDAARSADDAASVRSYENMARGWSEMIRHAERGAP